MATLNSPGVSVSVIDESFYTPSAPGTVPMIFVASAQDKTNASGTIAQGTTAANAGKVWLMTGQRDLADTFGVPHFYTDASSNPLHGDELNEYGLQAAYSLLGVSSRAYVVRADLDTKKLLPSSSVPHGNPVNGTLWADTASTIFGIKEWNSTTKSFTVKTPTVLDDDTPSSSFNGSAPSNSIGLVGNYCMVLTNSNAIKLYYKKADFTWVEVHDTFDSGKSLQISPHYDYPETGSWLTGSVWITTTSISNGASWSVKRYNAVTQNWDALSAPVYGTLPEATHALSAKGGSDIAVGSLFVEHNASNTNTDNADFKIWRRKNSGATIVVGNDASSHLTLAGNYSFRVRETLTGSGDWSSYVSISWVPDDNTTILASVIPAKIAASALVNVTASYNTVTKKLTFTHKLGGDIEFDDVSNAPIALALSTGAGLPTNLYTAPDVAVEFLASNWAPAVYEAHTYAPYTTPEDGQLWYSSVHDEVDIMVHAGTYGWVGYQNSNSPFYGITDPAGPIIMATEPVNGDRSDGSNLATGDIWIDTSDMEMYGKNIYVYDSTILKGSKWVKQDVTDQSTPHGWLFADARWATAGTTLTASSITALLSSNYLDPDAPDPAIYPKGMRLFNTRRSGFNVKKYISGYIDIYANSGLNARYPRSSGESMASYKADRWVSQHNVAADGSGVFGRMAQRAQVVQALKATIDTNTAIRDSDTVVFNLIATPGYPEAIQNMVAFNTDRGITAFVVGDTPFRLEPTGTALHAWGANTATALDNGDDGATTHDEYMALYYPSGYTNDNTGNKIVVPPSHMMLRTIINSDAKSFQWFAPAGTRRGGVDNATSVGYITGEGEFKTVALHQGLRDVLQDPLVQINPIATLPGVGLVAYGQRTRAKNASALDRINVARLVCYLRRQLDILARPFLFEPNDAQTRREIKAAAESLMLELVGSRALYDYVVVCDETNNTPARIDRSELYMDIAIEPVKAVEFIYIPLRLKNTGDIKAGL
jgi:hypothetical protein